MATSKNGSPPTGSDFRVIAAKGYAKIMKTKHGLPGVPSDDEIENMSSEELDAFLMIASDLAHLPPK